MRAEDVSAAARLPAFQFIEINSLRLPSPQHLYTHLLEVCSLPTEVSGTLG